MTALLNFCRPDPLRLRALAHLATAQASISALHEQFSALSCETGISLLKKIRRRMEKKPAEPAANPPATGPTDEMK